MHRQRIALIVCALSADGGSAQRRGPQAPGPTVTVRGHTFTQLSLFQRNVGGRDDMTRVFPPHKAIGKLDIDEARFRAVLAEQRQ